MPTRSRLRPRKRSPSLGAQITEAVASREATLATAQRLLLRELSTLEDESATKTPHRDRVRPACRPVPIADARARSATRRNGASYMLTALGKHYDFLHDTLLAAGRPHRRCARRDEGRARRTAPRGAPARSGQHATTTFERNARGARHAGHEEQSCRSLRQFFAIYRGTAGSDDVRDAPSAASARPSFASIPKEGRALVEHAAKDPMTVALAKSRPRSPSRRFAGRQGHGQGRRRRQVGRQEPD